MEFDIKTVREFIRLNSEPAYQKFSQRLLPKVKNISGVRIPRMHAYVDAILSDGFKSEAIKQFESLSFEETMIEGLLIAKGPWRKGDRKKMIRSFVPKIDNWSHCDTFCKFIVDVDESYLSDIRRYALMKSEYRQRFALVMLLEHFISDAYIATIFDIVNTMSVNEYYAQMALAWLLSMIFAEYPSQTLQFLRDSSLDIWTKNKTVQKIKESLKTSPMQRLEVELLKKSWTAQ